MADSKISALAATTTLADTDEVPVASSGASKKITGANLKSQVIASDAELAAIAGLTSAADRLPYFTGSGTAALATFTAAGRALVDDADAATQRTTLGLVIGTDVVAPSAPLNGQSGVLVPTSRGWQSGTVAMTANRAYFARFVVPKDISVATIAFYVSVAAGSDDACDVGIYTVSGSDLVRVVSAGATTGKLNGSTGRKTITISSTPLTAGTVYYAAFSCGSIGSTAATLTCTSFNAGIDQMFGTTLGMIEAVFKGSAHPLGATVSAPSTGISNVPILALT